MKALDYLFGGFAWWRAWRGGEWRFYPLGAPTVLDGLRKLPKGLP